MKSFSQYFTLTLFTLILISYLFGITDDAFDLYRQKSDRDSWVLDSLAYYIYWVLPYWALIIFVVSGMVGLFGILMHRKS